MDGPVDTTAAPPPPAELMDEPAVMTPLGHAQPAPVTAALESPEESRWGVLRHTHFRTVWFAMFGSYIGNWFEFVAIRWIVSQETKSEDWMAYLAIAQLCPTLLLGMVGGLVADSVNRRKLLVITQGVMMAIALAMAAVTITGHATRWVLLGLTLAQGITVVFNMPAWQVLTPRLVPKAELTAAITLNGVSFNSARAIGPAIGGLIMKTFQSPSGLSIAAVGAAGTAAAVAEGASRGAAALLFFNAATFVLVMVAVLRTPDAPAPSHMRSLWRRPGEAWARTREAGHWVWSRKGPRALLISSVVFASLATPIMQLLPLIVSEAYGKQEDAFGLLLGVMGVGAVVGAFGMRRVPRWYPMHHFIPVCVMLGGFSIFCFSLTRDPLLASFIMFFVGVFWMCSFNSMAAAMQHLVDDEMRGRVSAVMNTIALGLMPVGTLIASRAGRLAEATVVRYRPAWDHPGLGTQMGLAFVSLVLTLAGIAMLTWRTPEVDGLKPGDPGYDRTPGFWRGLTGAAHRPIR